MLLPRVVLLPPRQGVLLVAHRHGAAVHSVHTQAVGEEPEKRAHPRTVRDAAGKGARLFPRQPSAGRISRQGFAGGRSTRPDAHRALDSQCDAGAGDAGSGTVDAGAIEWRGWAGRHLSRHGERAGSDDASRLPRRRPAARDRQTRIAKAAGDRPLERLLPAVRFSGLGHGLGQPRHAGSGLQHIARRRYAGARLAANRTAVR